MESQSTDNSLLLSRVLELTDPALALALDARNTWKNELTQAGARVALYRNYEAGEHRSGITDQMRSMLRIVKDASGIEEFNDNYCEVIVSKMADRLFVNEVSIPKNEPANKWLEETLERNDFISIQDAFYRNSIIDGEVLVCVDIMTLKWSVEPLYDGFDGTVAIYSDDDRINPVWVCKMWSESTAEVTQEADLSTVMKMIVYQAGSISYWQGKPSTDEVIADNTMVRETPVYPDNEDSESVLVAYNQYPWALGKTPFVRFANRLSRSSGAGRSELKPAIPLQDALNRTLHSMIMASEFGAFTIIWSLGMEINASDITPGAVVNMVLKDKNGVLLTELTEEAAAFLAACKVGQFDATPMEQYFTQINTIAKEMSHITQTPIYGITTEGQVSGDALKQLEVGLIGKVQRFQRDNTDVIKTLVQLTAEIQTTFINMAETTNAPPDEIKQVNVIWKSAELLNVDTAIATLVNLRKNAAGLFSDDFYRTKVGAILGMNKDEISEENKKAVKQSISEFALPVGNTGEVPVVI